MSDCFVQCAFSDKCNHVDCDKEVCRRRVKLEELYDRALLSVKQRNRTVLMIDADNTDFNEYTRLAKIEADIVNFIKNGNNLYIHSTTSGNGKTEWSVRLIQSYLNKIWLVSELKARALFISVSHWLDELKKNITQKSDYIAYVAANILEADVVVFDDIASKSATDYEMDQLFNVINSRILAGKSNIFTSNLNENDLYTALGSRLASRVARESINIEFKGADKRPLRNGGEY